MFSEKKNDCQPELAEHVSVYPAPTDSDGYPRFILGEMIKRKKVYEVAVQKHGNDADNKNCMGIR